MKPAASPVITPRDLVAGLGTAPRELLAASLALFEDSTLSKRLGGLFDKWTSTSAASKDTAEAEAARSVGSTIDDIRQSAESDDCLRIRLWIHLREAHALPPLTFGTIRSASTAADDLVAAAMHGLQPGFVSKKWDSLKRTTGLGTPAGIPSSFDELARQTIAELVDQVMEGKDAASEQARAQALRALRERLGTLSSAERRALLDAVGTDELNDAALVRILLTGGGLAALNAGVGMAGFGAYILAAKASAFIPLVSGPALVSLLAVLSNPVTLVLATVGMGWVATSSSETKIRRGIAARVMSLLALHGLSSAEDGLVRMASSFRALPTLKPAGRLGRKTLGPYADDWALIGPLHRSAVPLDDSIARRLNRPLAGDRGLKRLARLFDPNDPDAQGDMKALGALTLGELFHNAYRLDPLVLRAADFSRIEELDDPVAFSAFAHRVTRMNAASHLGAYSNLKGYVAEQYVAARLVEQGHVVEFPALSNEPGWDLAVDGVKFQVKNASDLGLLDRHFAKGYDYPVIANSEVAGMLARRGESAPAWAEHVHFVEGYSQGAVDEITKETLDAADGMLHANVPVFAFVLAGLRNVRRLARGELTATQAMQEALVDGSVRSGLAVAGNVAGVTLGLMVFGPAGALVLGAALPVLSRWQAARVRRGLESTVRGERYVEWETRCRQALSELGLVLNGGLDDKIARLRAQQPASRTPWALYLGSRIEDDIRFLQEARVRLRPLVTGKSLRVEEASVRVVSWLATSTLHPAVYQAPLRKWMELVAQQPVLGERLADTASFAGRKTAEAGQSAWGVLRKWTAGRKPRSETE